MCWYCRTCNNQLSSDGGKENPASFSDTSALDKIIQQQENGIEEGSISFNNSEGEYFGNPENEDAERQMNKYIVKIVDDIYNSTVDNMTNHPNDYSYDEEKPYWVSTDRAMFIAENESNTLFNVKEFVDASAKGYTHTIWMAYNDNRVRDTHLQTNGAKIPIGSYFDVGAARMLYPKDVTSEFSTGAEHPEEVVGCRCVAVYV